MRRSRLGAVLAAPLALALFAGPANAAGASVMSAPAIPRVASGIAPAVDDPHAAKRDVDAQISQLEADLHDTDAEFAQAVLDLQRTEASLATATTALASAEASAVAAESAHRQALQDLAVAEANEAKAQEELSLTREEIATGRQDVAQFAAQLWMDQGAGPLQAAATAANPTQLVDRLSLVDTVTNLRAGSLSRLAAAQASQVSIESHLTAVRTDGERAEQAAADAQAQAAAARDSAAAAKAELETLTATQRQQAASVQARKADEEARLASMRDESARLEQVLAERAAAAVAAAAAAAAAAPAPAAGSASGSGSSGSSATASGATLAWPLPGGIVTSEFGWRIHPITGVGRLHAGRDIATPCGQPVIAAADGVVVSAGDAGGYGNRVVVDHGVMRGVGLATSYNHLQSIAVWGGSVRRGQVIGYEGTTGFSTGCHLHFEVYENGAPVDPRGWL